MVQIVTSESEFSKLISSTKLSVVDFYADWCGPCKAIAPRFEVLSRQYKDVQFLKVNVDNLSSVSGAWGVRAMPTFLFFRKGSKLDEVVGADIRKVENLVQKYAGQSSFPDGGGRTLSGKAPSTAAAAAGTGGIAARLGVSSENFVFVCIGLLFLYLMFAPASAV